MSATRSSSMRALRQLSAHSHQVRQLHMTGPTTFQMTAANSQTTVKTNPPRDLVGSRTEGVRSRLPMAASTGETSSSPASRTMVTSHNPVRPQPLSPSAPQKSTREINTSRTLKSPNDASTVDFAFLPRQPAPVPMDNVNMRVPIMPDNYAFRQNAPPASDYGQVMRAEVITAAGEGTHVSAPSTMSEVSDNTAAVIDYSALAERMEQSVKAVGGKTSEAQGTVKQLWEGMIDDVFGPKRAVA